MQEDIEKTRPSMQSGGQFIDTLIGQWMKRTGTDIELHQTKEVAEAPVSQEGKKLLQNQEQYIQVLLRKLKQSQQEETSLSSTLEMEMRYKQEMQIKLNATWESIDTITEYCNYISESLASFQQHRVNLSNLYDNVILKQQEHIQQLQLRNTELKEVEKQSTQLKNELALREKRLQEATAEQNKLRKQLEDSAHELQLQKNGLMSTHAEEKSALVKEQQRVLHEYENLQLRLQTVQNEKCDIAKSAAQLQNQLVFQEEKMQVVLTEKDELQKQLENARNEFYMEKDRLANAHAEEKRKLVEREQQLLTKCESLQSQLNILQQDKSNIAETVVQKDELISKLLGENSVYQEQIEVMTASNKGMCNKYEALEEKQKMWEEELRTKMEKIQDLEKALSATKERETRLVNDINSIEKKLANEMNYSKNLESKLSDVKKDLQSVEMQNAEIQNVLKDSKAANELSNKELANVNQKLKILQQEKEEATKREIALTKKTNILYENSRAEHTEEVSALTSSYETRLLELRKTIDSLNDANNNTMQENSALKTSLAEMRKENINLKNDYQFIIERSKNLHDKLKEATESSRIKLTDTQESNRSYLKNTTQSKEKEKGAYKVRFDPEITEISEDDQSNVSTSADLKSSISDLGDNDRPLSQRLSRMYSMKRESPKEQEEEVTSAGKKFFKSRPTQPRTYSKRQ